MPHFFHCIFNFFYISLPHLEILSLQPRRAVDQPRGRGKDQAFQVEEHSLHIQHVSDNKQTNKQKKKKDKQTLSISGAPSTYTARE